MLFSLVYVVTTLTIIWLSDAQEDAGLSDLSFNGFYAIDIHWNEDGSELIALNSRSGTDIWVFDENLDVITRLDPLSDPRLPGGVGIVVELDWNPEGTVLAVPVVETFDGSILQIWDINTSTFESFPFDPIADVTWSPRGDLIAIRTETRVTIWDVVTRTSLVDIIVPGSPVTQQMDWKSDGSQIAMLNGEGVLWVWDVDEKRVVMELNPSEGEAQNRPLYWNVRWQPHSDWIALNDIENSTVEIWDTVQQTRMAHFSVPDRFAGLRWGVGGLAIVNRDFIRQIDLLSGDVLHEIMLDTDEQLTYVDWHPYRQELIYTTSAPELTGIFHIATTQE